MRNLDTIQKRYYNTYRSNDDPEKISAHEVVGVTEFQNGPRNNSDSIAGVLDTDLLEIVRDQLSCFQKGQFNSIN